MTFTSATPGQVTGNASWTGTLGTPAPFTVTTNGVAPNSGPAVKTFVNANIQITPEIAINPVSTDHTLTIHVNVNDRQGHGRRRRSGWHERHRQPHQCRRGHRGLRRTGHLHDHRDDRLVHSRHQLVAERLDDDPRDHHGRRRWRDPDPGHR